MFTLQNNDEVGEIKLGNSDVSFVDSPHTTSKFDLELMAVEQGEGLVFEIEYSTALFKHSTIESMAIHFVELIHNILEEKEASIYKLSMLPSTERSILMDAFNATDVHFDQEATFLDVFNENVRLYPNSVAVTFGSTSLTYKELG